MKIILCVKSRSVRKGKRCAGNRFSLQVCNHKDSGVCLPAHLPVCCLFEAGMQRMQEGGGWGWGPQIVLQMSLCDTARDVTHIPINRTEEKHHLQRHMGTVKSPA